MPSPSVPFGQSGQQNHEPQLQGNLYSPELARNAFVLEHSDVFVPYNPNVPRDFAQGPQT